MRSPLFLAFGVLGMRQSSVRVVRFITHPRVCGNPIRFPCLTSVVRERLFKVARVGSDIRYHESNQNGAASECFLIEKFATSIFELANRGLAHAAAVAVGKVEAPLVGSRVV